MLSSFLFTSCEDEDDGEIMESGSLMVESQVISQNMIDVNSATVNNSSGWVVVHKDENGAPKTPGIITEPVHLNQGSNEDLSLKINTEASISDGEKLWVMIHKDTGEENTYEFGTDNLDPPVTVNDQPVMKQITITAPEVQAGDQFVSANQALVSKAVAGASGWVVVHKDNGSGAPGAVVGHAAVDSGTTEDLQVPLTDTVDYDSGLNLFPMLHVDKGTEGEYEFPGADVPEIFGNSSPNIVLTSFAVESGSSTKDTVTVEMVNSSFDPASKTISTGTTVKWVNKDSYEHNVDSNDDIFASDNLGEGETFTYTFEETGTYDYTCTLHTNMDGTITVE